MKKILIMMTAGILVAFSAFALVSNLKPMTTDSHGHILVSLWKQFDDARSKDRPKRQAELLEEIISQAKEKRLAWDFYDAWDTYFEVKLDRNWKLRDSLNREYAQAVQAFNEPVVSFTYLWEYGRESSDAYCKKNAALLKAGRNVSFYQRGDLSSHLGGQLPNYIRDDYEYALWLSRDYVSLQEYLGDSYPACAYLEYLLAYDLRDQAKSTEELQRVADKYKGRAVALFAEGALILQRKRELDDSLAVSDDYLKLQADCKAFEIRRKSFSGKEALILAKYEDVKNLASALTEKRAIASVKETGIRVCVRNLEVLNLSICQKGVKKPLYEVSLKNENPSFYVYDTLQTPLPVLEDGAYTVKLKGDSVDETSDFEKYSLSLASREDSKGLGIYAADCFSGKPVGKADLVLCKGGEELARVCDFEFDEGFTPLPEVLDSLIKGRKTRYTLSCSLLGEDKLLKKSKELTLYQLNTYSPRVDDHDSRFCNVYTDRGAYNPGDTLHYKAVLYHGDLLNAVSVANDVKTVSASLIDSQGNKLASQKLDVNEFGSVAGSFEIPRKLRNGLFKIVIDRAGYHGSVSVRVDEYILPAFDIIFDPIEGLCLPGSEIRFSGKVETYTGHSLQSAKISYTLTKGNVLVKEGTLKLDAEGRFALDFVSDGNSSWSMYEFEINVTDGTGETQTARNALVVTRDFGLDVEVENLVSAECELIRQATGDWRDLTLVEEEKACVKFSVRNYDGEPVPMTLRYSLSDENGKLICQGKADSGESVCLNLPSSDLYHISAEAEAEDGTRVSRCLDLVRISPEDSVLAAPLKNFYRAMSEEVEPDGNMEIHFGSADGPVWALVELFGENKEVLEKRLLCLEGKRGEPGSLTKLYLPYKREYPDALCLNVFYFKDSSSRHFSTEFHRKRHTLDLPLVWTSFEDRTLPGHEYSFSFKTAPDVEILASVYDKSTDRIRQNYWPDVSLCQFSVASVSIDNVCGGFNSSHRYYGHPAMARSADKMAMVRDDAMLMDEAVGEFGNMVLGSFAPGAGPDPGTVTVRDNFATTLAFDPFIRSDVRGNAQLKFRTSDKLSTFIVSLFAHDKSMRNAQLRSETVVSLPVKLSVSQPKYLYVGDSLSISTTLSSNASVDVSGTLYMYQYNGSDYKNLQPLSVNSMPLTIPAGGNLASSFAVDVPDHKAEIGIKLVFAAASDFGDFSDGIFVSIPVRECSQRLTEAHSKVLLAGMDKESVLDSLRKSFVNVSPFGAQYREICIIDMVKAALPSELEPANEDLLSLSEAFYVRKISEKLGVRFETNLSNERLLEKIISCRNADGGFGWFEGMPSSEVITAVVLERFAKLSDAGLYKSDFSESVSYLDREFFSGERPFCCGGISSEQYLYLRSMYPDVEFAPKLSDNEQLRFYKNFRKETKAYLVPRSERGLDGMILSKARRLRTLLNLSSSDEGTALAKNWGVSIGTKSRLLNSLAEDLASILEYAVAHPEGGVYYPNAVMPFRGLLESEAYAHSLICDLLSDYAASSTGPLSLETESLADGLRIWLTLQKETQNWGNEPAFVDALNSILSGSEKMMQTKVLVLTKSYEKPFSEIAPSGNGFTIQRKFLREISVPDSLDGGKAHKVWKEILSGEQLNLGDRIRAEYRVHSDENRSFVLLRAPREAGLRPENQLSGFYGFGLRPLRINDSYSVTPFGYRNVKEDCTEFYFDTYPEEDSVIVEDFYVSQSGKFSAPVVEIESLYAPHYRGNDGFCHFPW